MAYYKVRIEVWCDWNPAEGDLDDIVQSMGVGEAICTMREVIAVVNRPQDIEDEDAMAFFVDQRAMRMRVRGSFFLGGAVARVGSSGGAIRVRGR
jgi:hypothetical protein